MHIRHILPPPHFAHFLLLRVPFIPIFWEKAGALEGSSWVAPPDFHALLTYRTQECWPRDGTAHSEPDPSTLIKQRTH